MGFARPEADEVTYIATAKELNIDPYIDNSPRKLDSTTEKSAIGTKGKFTKGIRLANKK